MKLFKLNAPAEKLWNKVDQYIAGLLARFGAAEAALDISQDAGLPNISVSAPQGKLLQILASSIGARRILEIGTLGGYSTIWIAHALPANGKLVSLE